MLKWRDFPGPGATNAERNVYCPQFEEIAQECTARGLWTLMCHMIKFVLFAVYVGTIPAFNPNILRRNGFDVNSSSFSFSKISFCSSLEAWESCQESWGLVVTGVYWFRNPPPSPFLWVGISWFIGPQLKWAAVQFQDSSRCILDASPRCSLSLFLLISCSHFSQQNH